MSTALDPMLSLQIRAPNMSPFVVDVPAECTMFELQAVVWSLVGLEPEEQLLYSGLGMLPTNAPQVLLADFAIRNDDTIHVKKSRHALQGHPGFAYFHQSNSTDLQLLHSSSSNPCSQRSSTEQSASSGVNPALIASPCRPQISQIASQSRKRNRSEDLHIDYLPNGGAGRLMPTIVTPRLPFHTSINSISPSKSSGPSSSSASKYHKIDPSPHKYFHGAFALSVGQGDEYFTAAAKPSPSQKDMLPDDMNRAIYQSISGWQRQHLPQFQPPSRSENRKPIGNRATCQIDAEAALILVGMPGQSERVPRTEKSSAKVLAHRGRSKRANLLEKSMQTTPLRAVEGNSKHAKQVIKLSATVSARVVTADPAITTLSTIETQLKDMLKLCHLAPEIYDML